MIDHSLILRPCGFANAKVKAIAGRVVAPPSRPLCLTYDVVAAGPWSFYKYAAPTATDDRRHAAAEINEKGPESKQVQPSP